MIETKAPPAAILVHRSDDGAFRIDEADPIEIARVGEFGVALGDRRVVQVIDPESLDAVVADFRARRAQAQNFPGLLLDFDHFSHDTDKPSRAAGWIEDLEHRDGVLLARVRWSRSGREAVEGGDYRLISPVFDGAGATDLGGGRFRATRLVRAAVTNDPNIGGLAPLSHRTTTEHQTMLTKIAEALGLQGTIDETAALAAIADLKHRADALAADHAQLVAERVEADIVAHADVIGEGDDAKAAARQALMANRSGALAYFGSLRKSARAALPPIHHRAAARPPQASPTASVPAEQSKLVSDIIVKHRCSFRQAWEMAQRERPELFTLS